MNTLSKQALQKLNPSLVAHKDFYIKPELNNVSILHICEALTIARKNPELTQYVDDVIPWLQSKIPLTERLSYLKSSKLLASHLELWISKKQYYSYYDSLGSVLLNRLEQAEKHLNVEHFQKLLNEKLPFLLSLDKEKFEMNLLYSKINYLFEKGILTKLNAIDRGSWILEQNAPKWTDNLSISHLFVSISREFDASQKHLKMLVPFVLILNKYHSSNIDNIIKKIDDNIIAIIHGEHSYPKELGYVYLRTQKLLGLPIFNIPFEEDPLLSRTINIQLLCPESSPLETLIKDIWNCKITINPDNGLLLDSSINYEIKHNMDFS